MKRAFADFFNAAEGQFFEFFAAIEGVFADRLHVFTDHDAFHAAIVKGIRTDFFQAVGQNQFAL